MTTRIIFLLFTLMLSSNVLATQTGKLTFPAMGLQFTLPDGWSGQQQGGGYYIQSANDPGFILLFENFATTTKQLKEQMNNGLSQQSIQLKRSGDFVAYKKGNKKGIACQFKGHIDNAGAQAWVISLINPDGPGLSIVAAASVKKSSDKYKKLATQIADSVVFSAPDVAKKDASTRQWQQWLQNARLSRVNNIADKDINKHNTKVYKLCRNHTFYYSHNSRSSIDTDNSFAFSSTNNITYGHWQLGNGKDKTPVLNLHYDNGQTDSFPLSFKAGKVALNNESYAYSRIDHCH